MINKTEDEIMDVVFSKLLPAIIIVLAIALHPIAYALALLICANWISVLMSTILILLIGNSLFFNQSIMTIKEKIVTAIIIILPFVGLFVFPKLNTEIYLGLLKIAAVMVIITVILIISSFFTKKTRGEEQPRKLRVIGTRT